MNSYLKIFVLFLLVGFNGSLKAQTLEELSSEINEIREEISNLDKSSSIEAIKIDKSLKELNKVVDFVEKQVDTNDIETAISSLNIAEKTIQDISKAVPELYSVEKVKEGKEFPVEQLQEVMIISKKIKKTKINKNIKISEDIINVKSKGLDVLEIANNINQIGIKTIDRKEISKSIAISNLTNPTLSARGQGLKNTFKSAGFSDDEIQDHLYAAGEVNSPSIRGNWADKLSPKGHGIYVSLEKARF